MRSIVSKYLANGKYIVGGALVLGAASAATAAGCSSSGTPSAGGASAPNPNVRGTAPADTTGTVGMQLTLPGGEQVNSVSWVITGPDGGSMVVQTGMVDLQNSTTIGFLVGGIPAGANYLISLSGTSTDGLATCVGSAQFTVMSRMTANVSVALQCNTAVSEAGSAQINGTTYNCASVSSISANPAETTIGSTVAITGLANGPNVGGLTYAWSAPTGAFDTPNAASVNYTCTTAGPVTLTLTVGDGPVVDGGACNPALATGTIHVQCDAPMTGGGDAGTAVQALVTTLDPGVAPTVVTINQGTAIGEGSLNGATPSTLTNLAADPNNTETIVSAINPFESTGNVPDTAAGFCNYPTGDPRSASRTSPAPSSRPRRPTVAPRPDGPMAPFYFPLVYTTTNTTTDNAFGGKPPIIGLFDWRPKDIDEALVVAESDDHGKTWYFMQTVLELNPDYTNPISGGYSAAATSTGCPTTITDTNANFTSANGSHADDGWGHAAIIQLPGAGNVKTGQFLYMLDRNTNAIPGTSNSIVDNAPL